ADRRGDVVGQIRKRGDAVDGGGGQGPLQGAATGASGHRDDGAVVARAQVAQRVFDPDARLLREGRSSGGGRRGLRLNRQIAGRDRVHGEVGGGRAGPDGAA